MKYSLLTIVCAVTAFSCFAQASDEETQAVANLLGVQKKQVIAKLVTVEPKDSATFWNLYNEYQQKNLEVSKSRFKLYEGTANAYGNMTDKVADSLAKKYFENRVVQEQMLEDYYQKIKSKINATVAFEFYQAEVYLLTSIRAHIMQQIPTFGEFKASSAGGNR